MRSVYIYIEEQENFVFSHDEYKILCLVRNILMYRHMLITWLEKDFNNDTMASIAELRHSTVLLSASRIDGHTDDDDLRAAGIMLKENKVEDEDLYLLFVHQHVNVNIAQMYRKMLECDIQQKLLDDEKFYPDTAYSSIEKPVKSLWNLIYINKGDGSPQYMPWMKILLKAMNIQVQEKILPTEIKNYVTPTEEFDFLLFDHYIDDEDSMIMNGYNAEYLEYILLDFLFSAMKYGIDWSSYITENGNDASFSIKYNNQGPILRYKFYVESKHKCEVKIRRQSGSEGIWQKRVPYDMLVLESKLESSAKNDDAKGKKRGMSIATIKWYFEGIWKRYAATLGCNESEMDVLPKVEEDSEEDGSFILLLPILKKRSNEA
jgi:hypothetical protein